MASILFSCLVLAVLGVVSLLQPVASQFNPQQQQHDSMIWTHRAILDREGKVVLLWTPNIEDIVFEVQARTKGWIGIGLSPDGKMPNSDIVVGWVINGEPSLQDQFAVTSSQPVLDEQQDYKLLTGYENDTHTVLRFSRRYDTCDPKDTKITNDTMTVIYAFTEQDPIGSVLSPHVWQGHRKLYLTGMNIVVPGVMPNTKTVEMRLPNITLSKTEKSLCWQKVFKYVPLSSREVINGFEPLWNNVTAPSVDHLWLYRCDSSLDTVMWDQYSGDRGSICDSHDAISQYGNCTRVFATAAAGSLGYILPGGAGYSLNQGVEGSSYFLLRAVYNNWVAQDDIKDDTGFALIYAEDSIQFPAATLIVGHDLGISQIIPLDQKAFVTVGHCDAECTKTGFSQDGIFVYEVFLDARSFGRKMTLRHLRNGTELEPIAKDNSFDSGSQVYRSILEPVHVLPGDNLMLECTYDTTNAASTLVGGIQSDSEACRAYLNYFPKVKLETCTSSPPLTQIFDFIGTKQIAIEPSMIDYKATRPPHASTKLTEYAKFFNWVTRASDYQNLTKSSYTSICKSEGAEEMISEPRHAPKVQNPLYEVSGCNVLVGDNNTHVFTPSSPKDPEMPTFHPDGSVPHPQGGGGQDVHGMDPMLGDQSHGQDGHQHQSMQPDQPFNDTSNFVDNHGTGNHSASTQEKNAANSNQLTNGLLALLCTIVLLACTHK